MFLEIRFQGKPENEKNHQLHMIKNVALSPKITKKMWRHTYVVRHQGAKKLPTQISAIFSPSCNILQVGREPDMYVLYTRAIGYTSYIQYKL